MSPPGRPEGGSRMGGDAGATGSDRPRVVAITGAAGHLGRAVAARFAAEGARLVLIDRDAAALGQVFGGDGPTRCLLAADLLDADALAAAWASVPAAWGGVAVLCNLAGGFAMGERVHETSAATWELMQDLNLSTLLHASRVVVPQMLAVGGGRVINVAAGAALRGPALMGAYAAAKAGVVRLTEAMAAELREHGINVNCVLPSIIDTPPNRAVMPEADATRWVAPADLAEVIAFLASDAARAVHGAALPVNGLS